MPGCHLFSLLLFLGCINLPSAKEEESLYGPQDSVVILDKDNFNSYVHGSKTAWLVEFYSSWCGHCIRFAPEFKSFAKKIKGWEDVVRVGVLDCSNENHVSICRDYKINGYPTLKFFSPFSNNSSKGKERESMNMGIPGIIKDTANFAVSQDELRSRFPRIQSGLEVSAFEEHPNAQLAVFINSEKYKYGASLFLNLYKNLSDLNVPLYLSSKDSMKASFLEKGNTIVKSFLIEGNDLDKDVGDILSRVLEKKKAFPITSNNVKQVNQRRYTVFMSDLENAFIYSFKHEIATHSIISGDKLRALQTFMEVLYKYFPGRKATRHFISELKAWIFSHEDVLKGEELEKHFNDLSKRIGAFQDTPKDWKGCKGSSKRYRGYPCSLWTLFHALSVNHAGVTSDGISTRLDVLNAMQAYIKEYFGCRDCARHFQQEWLNDPPSKTVVKAEDSIIWLWRTHNKVNIRLSGDISDDPSLPKKIFPDPEHCSQCYVDTGDKLTQGYDLRQVLDFLNNLYGKNISYEGLGKKDLSSHENLFPSSLTAHEQPLYKKSSGIFWFSSLDMGLLLIMYLAACALIFCACKKLMFKRRCKILSGVYHKV